MQEINNPDPGEAIDNIKKVVDGTSLAIVSWLKAFDVPQSDIEKVLSNANVKSSILDGANLISEVISGDPDSVARAATAIAVGVITSATVLAILPEAVITAFIVSFASSTAADFFWEDIKTYAEFVGKSIDDLQDWLETNISDGLINLSLTLDSLFDQTPEPGFAKAESITSPLVIDLDGDGVEMVPETEGVYFDHDNNGFAEKSGWVSSDDGLLVLDRNQDGLINNGMELFGNNTPLSMSGNAENGFLALGDYDRNQDGVIDQSDGIFNDLNVWQDFNQDGISQENELFTLNEAGISSISTAWSETMQLDLSGNEIRQLGNATLTDGRSATVADVWFDANLSHTRNYSKLPIDEITAALPNIRGFGNVRDLHQAMVLDPVLQQFVNSFVTSDDENIRQGLLDDIIYQWTGVQDVDPYSRDPSRVYGHVMDARQLEALEELVGQDYLGTWCWGERDPNPHGRAAPVLIEQYNEFKNHVYGQLMAGSHFSDVFELIGITFDFEIFRFKPDISAFTSSLESLLADGQQLKVAKILDTFEAIATFSTDLTAQVDQLQRHPLLGPVFTDNLVEGTSADDVLMGGRSDDLIIGEQGDDTLLGNLGDDTYVFNRDDGSDRIYDAGGHDVISFGDAVDSSNLQLTRNVTSLFVTLLDENGQPTDDRLQIDNVFDFDGSIKEGVIEVFQFADGTQWDFEQIASLIIQNPTAGDDAIYGTHLNDKLEGLEGNDVLYGGAGNDNYLFTFGDGEDIIYENNGTDSIEFYGGISPENVTVSRVGPTGEDIVLSLVDQQGRITGDQITIIKAYENLVASSNQVEEVKFVGVDDQVMTVSLVDLEKNYQATALDDVIYGFDGNDVIRAGSGNDVVHAAAGDDDIYGGPGNDYLQGGAGSDTYLFSSGDGHDVIDNSDRSAFSLDAIELDASINPKQVRLLRVGDDLLISIDRNRDSIHLKGYFEADTISAAAVDEIRFSDGTVLTVDDIKNLSLEATQGADFIEGFLTDDSVSAQAGDDVIYARSGDDMVAGDQGNDLIFGENGNDMLFGNHGRDQLFGGQGEDMLDGGREADQLYGSSGEDLIKGGEGNDYLDGGSQNDQLQGNNGDDALHGMRGDDQLIGGKGNDGLSGGLGDDLLQGDAGNDTYHYAVNDGQDVVEDTSGYDVLELSGFEISQIWLTQQQNDLLIQFAGKQGQVTVKDWNTPEDGKSQSGFAIDEIRVGDLALINNQIESLVNAMAAFTPESGGGIEQFTMPEPLQPVLAASWQPA